MSVDESPLAAAAVHAPRGAGVYFFLADDRELLYVGKAGDLRARLTQHASAKPGPREIRRALLYERVADVYWEELVDETTAAAREADLIVSLRPPFNASHVAEGRWNFIVVTEAHQEALRFELTEAAQVRGAYGCFPHLGRGLARRLRLPAATATRRCCDCCGLPRMIRRAAIRAASPARHPIASRSGSKQTCVPICTRSCREPATDCWRS